MCKVAIPETRAKHAIFCSKKCSRKNSHRDYQLRNKKYSNFRIILIEILGGCCYKCSSKEELQLDHIKPIGQGGKHHISNIQVLCDTCHREKTKKEMHLRFNRGGRNNSKPSV